MRNTPTDLAALSVAESAAAIRDRAVSAAELTDACLQRVERWQPTINAFIAIDAGRALDAAKAADSALARGDAVGPLHGVPLAHKDMFARAGESCSGGSLMLGDIAADATATVIERLGAAGAISVGGLNMAEFAAGPTGHNEHVGDCRNPWNPAYITGGSSSGSGAAVASRIVPAALGSDTGGSVRLPAAICGIIGLKPTYGRVSRFGAMPRAWSLDTIGPLTRSVADCALIASIIAGPDPKDPTTWAAPSSERLTDFAGDLKGLRVGIMPDRYMAECHGEIAAAHEAALDVMVSLGAERVAVDPQGFDESYALAEVISKSEAAALHRKWMRERPQDYSMVVFSRTEAGLHLPATSYLEALALRGPLLRRFRIRRVRPSRRAAFADAARPGADAGADGRRQHCRDPGDDRNAHPLHTAR